jgi:hypothetical protein
MKYVVLVLSPPDYQHSNSLQEVAETLEYSLRQLDHDALITRTIQSECRHIVLGS